MHQNGAKLFASNVGRMSAGLMCIIVIGAPGRQEAPLEFSIEFVPVHTKWTDRLSVLLRKIKDWSRIIDEDYLQLR